MTTQYDSGRSPSTSFLTFVLALLLGAGAIVFFLRHASEGLPARLATLITARPATFNTSVPAVVEQIQHLSRLETVVYSIDSVVEGSKTSPVFPDILAADRILLVVHGQSVAGVDLAKLKPEDVRISGADRRSVHVTLPASEIFTTALDNEHTRVYSRTTGLLVPVDRDLESDTRAKAQEQLRQAALTDGILDTARKNARSTISALLYSLGFEHVEVN